MVGMEKALSFNIIRQI